MSITIYVVTHKCFIEPKDEIYQTIIVGPADLDLKNALRDNTGVNIAHKNSNYCELTALYWIWKNVADKDRIIGMCHYRRFFSKSRYRKSSKYFLTKKDVQSIFCKYDVVLPKRNRWGVTVGENYYNYGEGKEKDLLLVREIISNIYPQYLKDFDQVINAKAASYRNMFIMRKILLDEYCEWLFAILGELEKSISLDDYTKAEARVFGYLSEILLNVWILHKNLKIKYVPIVLTELPSFNFNLLKMRFKSIIHLK